MSKKHPYMVLPGLTVKYDGQYHGPDSVIHMPKEVGDAMKNCVAPCIAQADTSSSNPAGDKPKDPKQVQSRIVEALIDMDTEDPKRENKELWTKGGELPELKELERRIGWPVTAAERKDAFEQFKTLKA